MFLLYFFIRYKKLVCQTLYLTKQFSSYMKYKEFPVDIIYGISE